MGRPTAEEVQVTIQDARNVNQEAESAAQELRALLNSEDLPPDVDVRVRQAIMAAESSEAEQVPSDAVQAARQASLTAAAACLAASAAGVTWEVTGADLKGVIITTLERAKEANLAAGMVVNEGTEPQKARDAAARVADAANVMAKAVRNASDIIDDNAAEVSLNAAELASEVANGSVEFKINAEKLINLSSDAQNVFDPSNVTDELMQVMKDAAEVAKAAEAAGHQASETVNSSSAQSLVIATNILLDDAIRMVRNLSIYEMILTRVSLVVSLTASAAAVSATCSAAAAAVGAESAARAALSAALSAAEEAASAATLLSDDSKNLNSAVNAAVNAAMAASQEANNAAQAAMAELQNGLALDTLANLAAEVAQMASMLTNLAKKMASSKVTEETIKGAHQMVKQMDNDWKVLTRNVQDMLTGTPEECCKMLLKQLAILNVAFIAQATMEAANRAAFSAVNDTPNILDSFPGTNVATMISQAGVAASTAKLAAKATDTSLAASAKSSGARMFSLSTAALLAFIFSIL
ncbi:uncharacterized protein LOC119130285 [Syngnathus acus]|uniref:uncharacterized protein LOC119130285 n=1 Tax=Syngnathus acus TaxID=161584 RepID=UPI001885AAEE|nr:uncharacterized protein LOC119130285 [Syngnathus acus]